MVELTPAADPMTKIQTVSYSSWAYSSWECGEQSAVGNEGCSPVADSSLAFNIVNVPPLGLCLEGVKSRFGWSRPKARRFFDF